MGRILLQRSGIQIFLVFWDLSDGIQILWSVTWIIKKIWMPSKIRILFGSGSYIFAQKNQNSKILLCKYPILYLILKEAELPDPNFWDSAHL